MVRIVNNWRSFPFTPHPLSVVYNDAAGSEQAAAECTLWKWAWQVKNCARGKSRLRVRTELSY